MYGAGRLGFHITADIIQPEFIGRAAGGGKPPFLGCGGQTGQKERNKKKYYTGEKKILYVSAPQSIPSTSHKP
jgi:hypothetical protein